MSKRKIIVIMVCNLILKYILMFNSKAFQLIVIWNNAKKLRKQSDTSGLTKLDHEIFKLGVIWWKF